MAEDSLETLTRVRNSPSLLKIGKNGLSSSFLNELKEQIKKNKFVKIKILKNAPFEQQKEVSRALKTEIDFIEIVETRGWTVIVTRK